MYNRSLNDRWKDLRMVLKPWKDVRYENVVVSYKQRLDGGGRRFGQDTIRFLASRDMPAQPRVFEWCAGPGFIGFSMLAHGQAETLCLADINSHAVRACQRTIAANDLGERVSVFLSDNLTHIPPTEHWNLVVGNPVHFADAYEGSLRAHDPGWRIHAGFYAEVGRFLAPDGLVLLQENCRGSTAQTFKPMIESAGLEIVFDSGPREIAGESDAYYFLGAMRAGDRPPAWLG